WTKEESNSALAALRKAGDDMKAAGLSPDAAWGEVHVIPRGGRTFPTSGFRSPGSGDQAAVVPNYGSFRDGKIVCDTGSSFRMIVSLDPKHVESWSILPYGESQDPANPHYSDQVPLFGRGEYKPTQFDKVKAGAAGFTRTLLETTAR